MVLKFKDFTDNSDVNLIKINESTLNRIIGTHNKNGYIIISAYRGDRKPSENRQKHLELMDDIKNNGFSFIKVFGGFIENVGTDDEVLVREPSLVVPNYPIGKTKPYEDTEKLFNMGVELCNKYNQDSFLYKDIDSKPKYIDKNGNVDMEFDGDYIINKPEQYFTSISKNNNGRFTFTEAYVVEPPQTLNGRHTKLLKFGESFVSNDYLK